MTHETDSQTLERMDNEGCISFDIIADYMRKLLENPKQFKAQLITGESGCFNVPTGKPTKMAFGGVTMTFFLCHECCAQLNDFLSMIRKARN